MYADAPCCCCSGVIWPQPASFTCRTKRYCIEVLRQIGGGHHASPVTKTGGQGRVGHRWWHTLAMSPTLETSRLSFRDFTVDDYDAVHAYGSDPVVTRYTAFGPNTPEQTVGFLQNVSAEPSREDRTNYNYALVHKQTNKLIG